MKTIEELVDGLRTFVEKSGLKKVVLGLSGGVDSALVAKIGVLALGKEKVTVLMMPNLGISSQNSVPDATLWAEELGITHHLIPIDDYLHAYKILPWAESAEARLNLQARVRATILYHFANSHGALVLGTGNKTELTLGYFTKYGDGASDVLPIGALYKNEVWGMAKKLGLPNEIIEKAPSAELREGQTDEEEMGMKYGEIDRILRHLESGKEPQTEDEKKLALRIRQNHHKNQLPPIL